MPLRPRRDRQRLFWSSIRAGKSVPDAVAVSGMSESQGQKWFRDAGGMPPICLVQPAAGRFLTIDDRERIAAGLNQESSIRAIARSIDKSASTVLHELRGNMHHQQYRSRGKLDGTAPGIKPTQWKYSPHLAQSRADQRAARPKAARLAMNLPLRKEVQNRLRKNHSPAQIAARMRLDFPDDSEMWVSHETIYQSLYVQGRGGLKRDLVKHLRTGRAVRKPRRKEGERRGRIKDMVMISERPPEIEDRAVPGHWEGDLITGAHNASAIGTLVERKTGFLMLLHLPDNHGALAVQEAMVEQMSQLPATLRQTLTWDQGSEMSNHVKIAEATGLEIYFCDPHSPWQRGSNENTNGLLRQYFPKGTDLSVHGPGYLEFVAAEINTRPRKRHQWATPTEALNKLLSEPSNPPGVASTG